MLIRWVLTASIMVFLRDLPAIQIMTLQALSIAWSMIIMGGMPYERPTDNYLQLLNEAMITAYLLMLASLTDFSAINPFKNEIAWIMLGSILLNIGINILKALIDIINVTKLYLRRMLAIRAR